MTSRSLTLCLCAAFGMFALQLAGAGRLAEAQSTYQWPDFQPDLQPGPSNRDVKSKPPTVTLSPPAVEHSPRAREVQRLLARLDVPRSDSGRKRIGDEGNGQRSEGEICSRKRARENATAAGALHTICAFRRRRASTASRAEDGDHSRHAPGWPHEHQMGLAAETMVHGHLATHAGTAPRRCLDKREGTHCRQAGPLTRRARSQVPRQFAGVSRSDETVGERPDADDSGFAYAEPESHLRGVREPESGARAVHNADPGLFLRPSITSLPGGSGDCAAGGDAGLLDASGGPAR